MSDGETILDGVVMDGSAMGILGKLLEFERHEKEIEPVKHVFNRHCVTLEAKLRLFVDVILVSSRSNRDRMTFRDSYERIVNSPVHIKLQKMVHFPFGIPS